MKRQPILAIFSLFYMITVPHFAFANGFIEDSITTPINDIFTDLSTPKERPGSKKIITGAKLITGAPFAPITGAVMLTAIMSFSKEDCRLNPGETLLYGTSGTSLGAAAAPLSPVAGSVDISLGTSQLSIEAIQHFSELKKQDLPEKPQANSNQPTATVTIAENGAVKNLEIPLEVSSKNLQLKQKLVTSLDQ